MSEPVDRYLERAGSEIASGLGRFRRRRRRRQLLVTGSGVFVAVAVAVSIGVVGVVRSDHANAEVVTIERREGFVDIAVPDPSAPVAIVRQRLEQAGIAVEIEEVAVGPSKVGSLLGLGGTGALTVSRYHVTLTSEARIVLSVGRAAAVGESYGAASDAFAVGEPLTCLSGPGGPASALAAKIPDGINVEWRVFGPDPTVDMADLGSYVIVQATSLSPTTAMVFVAEGKGQERSRWCP